MARGFRKFFTRTPARPQQGEIAGSNIGRLLAPYIGELPLQPAAEARYAYDHSDETAALQLYRSILKDERCSAALDQRLNAAISTPWEVEPGGESDIDRAAAEDLAMQLEALEFDRISRQLLHGVWYGWAVAEAIWKPGAGRVELEGLVVRSLDRFWWSAEGELLLRTWTRPQGEPVPAGKFVVLVRPGEHDDLPWTPGLARWCYWPVWMKRHGLQFWSVALEKFGAPTALGTYPKNPGPGEKEKMLDLLNGLATGVGVAIEEGQKIELLKAAQGSGGSGSGGSDFSAFVEYLDRSITTTILGQSSTTDQGPWRGTADVQKDVRDETVAADARLLDATLNSTIARWLTAWNFPTAATPRIRHDADPPEDLDSRATRERTISETAGIRPTMQHVMDVYGGEWEEKPRPEALEPGSEAGPGGGPPDESEEDDAEMAGGTAPPLKPPAGRVTPAAIMAARLRTRTPPRTRSRR